MKFRFAHAVPLFMSVVLLPGPMPRPKVGRPKMMQSAMVKKGVAHVKANGAHDKAYAEFSDKENKTWHNQDLYLVVYGLDGTVRAHGANAKMIGKNLIELKDIDGKAFVKERVDLAKSQGTFWQDYKFTNPETKKIEPKAMYCERLDDSVVCGGIYK
jgi:cytochrome c